MNYYFLCNYFLCIHLWNFLGYSIIWFVYRTNVIQKLLHLLSNLLWLCCGICWKTFFQVILMDTCDTWPKRSVNGASEVETLHVLVNKHPLLGLYFKWCGLLFYTWSKGHPEAKMSAASFLFLFPTLVLLFLSCIILWSSKHHLCVLISWICSWIFIRGCTLLKYII